MNQRLDETFAALRRRNRTAFMPYLPVGYPRPTATLPLLEALAAGGADLIELGIPFSDPMADGPVIQAATQQALSHGVRVKDALEITARFAGTHRQPILLMTYLNPILQYGLEAFCRDAADAGACGLIVADLSFEERSVVEVHTAANGLDLIAFLAPTSGPQRIAEVARAAGGFIYCVALTGVTGSQEAAPARAKRLLEEVRRHTQVPACLGFGIATPEQAKEMRGVADGVIVGSALIEVIRQNADQPDWRAVTDYVGRMRAALDDPENSD